MLPVTQMQFLELVQNILGNMYQGPVYQVMARGFWVDRDAMGDEQHHHVKFRVSEGDKTPLDLRVKFLKPQLCAGMPGTNPLDKVRNAIKHALTTELFPALENQTLLSREDTHDVSLSPDLLDRLAPGEYPCTLIVMRDSESLATCIILDKLEDPTNEENQDAPTAPTAPTAPIAGQEDREDQDTPVQTDPPVGGSVKLGQFNPDDPEGGLDTATPPSDEVYKHPLGDKRSDPRPFIDRNPQV